MKIQRLYIGDFGILRNQSLNDIHPGMVVIGGLNRAGKSTLMQILRYLGYGFPKGGDLPPASNNYEAEADIAMSTGDVYNLRLKGHGQPSIKRMFGSEKEIMTAEELYELDNYTYGQLFTISLDELSGAYGKSNDEKRKLQSILLGAGFKDMLLIPQLADEFYKEGDKIGGKRGDPKVKQFKPYYQVIEAGQKQRLEGLSQVGRYQKTREKLKSINENILKVQDEVDNLRDEVIRLDLAKNNYDTYVRIEGIRQDLAIIEAHRWEGHPSPYDVDRLADLKDRYISLRQELYNRELAEEIHANLRETLLDEKDELYGYRSGISGIEERLYRYSDGLLEYERKKQGIEADIGEIHSSWSKKDFDGITAIRTDQIRYHELRAMMDQHKELKRDYNYKLEKLVDKKEEKKTREGALKENSGYKPFEGIKRYYHFSLAFIVLGIFISFISTFPGVIIGVGGAIGAATYFIISSREAKESERLLKVERDRLKDLDWEILADEKSIAILDNRIANIEEGLKGVAMEMGLSEDAPYSLLPDHLLRLRDIQKRIEELKILSRRLEEERVYLKRAYGEYNEFIRRLDGESKGEDSLDVATSPEAWHRVKMELERFEDYLEAAQDIRIIEQKIEALVEEIKAIIDQYESKGQFKGTEEEIHGFMDRAVNAIEYSRLETELKNRNQSILNSMRSDRIREAFNLMDFDIDTSSEAYLEAFSGICRDYGSQDEAELNHRRLLSIQSHRLKALDDLNKVKQRLENELEGLRTIDNLAEGQRQIDSGRSELEILGDSYALNMAASFLLREAEKNLLDSMKDSLMDSAGNIFNRMTGGEYRGIMPSDRILESDFEAIPEEDMVPQTVDMLSRGTKEQLYLSVRLSRIMDIKPCLPVIIDDSLANFDSMHLGQSLDILWELSKTHQVFILTCHGDLVAEIANYDGKAQYWKLDRGKLELTDHVELMDYLS